VASLSTHVLDTAQGCPAQGLALTLYRVQGEQRVELGRYTTNADGRVDGGLFKQDDTELGEYEVVFEAGAYLRASGGSDRYLTQVSIRFSIYDQTHYHVPLLLSSFGYSTYRGS